MICKNITMELCILRNKLSFNEPACGLWVVHHLVQNSPMKMLKCGTWRCETSAWGICLLKQQYYHERHPLGLTFQISWKNFGVQSLFFTSVSDCSKMSYLSRRDSVIPGLQPASDQSMSLWKGSLRKKEGLRSGNPLKLDCTALCAQGVSYSLEHYTILNQLSPKVALGNPKKRNSEELS